MSLITEGQHGLKAHSDGPIPVQTRSERFKSVEHDAFPVVEGYEAEWKLTPLDKVRDLIDDELSGAPYEVESSDELTVEWVDRDDPRIGSAGIPEERAAANAWSSFEKALAITIPAGAQGEYSVIRNGFGPAPRAAHVVITAQAGSKAILILESSGSARLSENVEIVVDPTAELTLVSLQDWDDDAVHLASQFATIDRDARLNHFVVTLGGSVVRVNPSAHLQAEGADAELYGLYFADAGQHFEQRVYVHHIAPHTRSRVTYKGALQGEGARTVWVGDVLIGPDATGTDTYEQNRNLVLTEGTRADSIPNLEIQTGDIVGAGHASATGRFDDEQLFYLQARGIAEDEARRLVVFGFLAEIVQRIGSPTLVERLNDAIEDELAGGRR